MRRVRIGSLYHGRINILSRGRAVSENEEIVENTRATMDMEGLPLPDDSVRRIESYLDGELSLEQSIDELLKKYKVA